MTCDSHVCTTASVGRETDITYTKGIDTDGDGRGNREASANASVVGGVPKRNGTNFV